MYRIDANGIITVNRGDTFTISLPVNLDTTADSNYYEMQDEDKIYFALMEPHQPFECALIRKVFTKDNQDEELYINMEFSTDDTEYLVPGNYYYMLKLKRNDLVDTIVSKKRFILLD